MGMLQIIIGAVPEGEDPRAYAAMKHEQLCDQLQEEYGTCGFDGCTVEVLKPADFEENWSQQESHTEWRKEKYKKLTDEGRVIVAEIDY